MMVVDRRMTMAIPAPLERLRVAWWLRACERVGADPRLHGRPTIYAAPGRIHMGARVRLSSRPVASHLVAGPDALLDIGDDVSIGHGAAIAAYERVEIGAGTRIGPYAVIMDTNFHGASGGREIEHDTRPIVIGRNCRIGSRVTVTRGASIGDGAEILAGSVVSSAIPAGSCAGGARARVFGQAGAAASRWDGVFAQLPELIRVALGLESPPEIDTPLPNVPQLTEKGASRIAAAIANQFGLKIDPSDVLSARSIADLAVEIVRSTKQ
jgi:acetyltransferase-like isoleucine patch superfamily enzyme